MVNIQPKSESEMLSRWSEHRESRRRVAARQEERERTFINFDLALSATEARFFFFRGRKFGVPPIPWRLAGEIADLWDERQALSADTPRSEARDVVLRLVKLFARAARPVRLTDRVRAWFRSPFRDATVGELVEIHGFFLLSAMTDAGSSPKTAAPPHPSMSPPNSSGSSESAPRGRTMKGSRSPGSTSNSGDDPPRSTAQKTRSGSRASTAPPPPTRTVGATGSARNGISWDGDR